MATFALRSKITRVPVVLVVTAYAGDRQCHFLVDRGVVAFNALEVLVFSFQREMRLVVVEIPVLPIARIVASVTARAQRALVNVLFFVAGVTVGLGVPEYHGCMALLAFDQQVRAGQGESSQAMVE